ncbi:hypothetical protein F8M41_012581 [Gigaspora margarita]|uniref:Uncharacterized protein n=1 Tax=Gigaspora margarita TaxID=4874 RepID=A0A8H4EPI5_GIGMA|nr:hypothetical protein F8M41_012581 [Gigaspora margarita]
MLYKTIYNIVKKEERANNEEQDALYDIDPFPQYPNSNQCLMLYYFSIHLNQSHKIFLMMIFITIGVNVNQYANHSSVSVKYELLSPTMPEMNNNASNILL